MGGRSGDKTNIFNFSCQKQTLEIEEIALLKKEKKKSHSSKILQLLGVMRTNYCFFRKKFLSLLIANNTFII